MIEKITSIKKLNRLVSGSVLLFPNYLVYKNIHITYDKETKTYTIDKGHQSYVNIKTMTFFNGVLYLENGVKLLLY